MANPTYHILVCNSFRVGGDPQGICNRKDAVDLLQMLETEIVDRGIDALVSSTGCRVSRWGIHAHNDLGMATANSVTAAESGADSIDVTVLGLGERAGNAALEEVAMALELTALSDGHGTGIRTESLTAISQRVAELLGEAIHRRKPIVGCGVFEHESGLHVHAMIRNPRSYEPFPSERVGGPATRFLLGKHSGASAVERALREIGRTGCDLPTVQRILCEIRRRADRLERGIDAAELEQIWWSLKDAPAGEAGEQRIADTAGGPAADR